MSQAFLWLLLALSALVRSTNGTVCGPSDLYDQQTQYYSESQDRMGTIGVSCKTTSGGGGGGGGGDYSSNSFHGHHLGAVLGVSIPLFIIFWVAVGICCFCVRRKRAANAAAINHYQGQTREAQMAYGTDHKSYPTGKPVSNHNNV